MNFNGISQSSENYNGTNPNNPLRIATADPPTTVVSSLRRLVYED